MSLPKGEEWLFSFGYGHRYPNNFVRLTGTYDEARAKMVKIYGAKWAFQYPASKEQQLKAHGMYELKEIKP